MREEEFRENQVLQALRSLAENDREKEAPPEMEARLLGAFRLQHARQARRVRRQRFWAGAATLAAGLVIALLLWPNRTPKTAVSAAPLALQIPEAVQPAGPAVAMTVEKVTPTRRKLARRVVAVRPPERRPEPREVVTDFFPLMDPTPSFERGQMLRVQLPAAAMRTVGLPVQEEHLDDLVQADVLVGEEGMPRAIRFVRFDVK